MMVLGVAMMLLLMLPWTLAAAFLEWRRDDGIVWKQW
jgi:hypothetical protein